VPNYIDGGGGGVSTAEAELPAPVEPAQNAVPVAFPWEQARAAVTALNSAKSLLDGQLDRRAAMRGFISDWEGAYRDEFDGKYWRLMSGGSGLVQTLATRASSIVTGAEEANARQRSNNDRAAQPAGLTYS